MAFRGKVWYKQYEDLQVLKKSSVQELLSQDALHVHNKQKPLVAGLMDKVGMAWGICWTAFPLNYEVCSDGVKRSMVDENSKATSNNCWTSARKGSSSNFFLQVGQWAALDTPPFTSSAAKGQGRMDVITWKDFNLTFNFCSSAHLDWAHRVRTDLPKLSKAGLMPGVLAQSRSHPVFPIIFMSESDPLRLEIRGNDSWSQISRHFYRE